MRGDGCAMCEPSRKGGLVRCRDCGSPLGVTAWHAALTPDDDGPCPVCGHHVAEQARLQASIDDMRSLLQRSERAANRLTVVVVIVGLFFVGMIASIIYGAR